LEVIDVELVYVIVLAPDPEMRNTFELEAAGNPPVIASPFTVVVGLIPM
jgi:hypothetical protein